MVTRVTVEDRGSGTTGGGGGGGSSGGGGSGGVANLTPRFKADLSSPQIKLLGDAYQALRESVYSALVMQTRLKPYMDSIGLVIDEQGVRLDFDVLNTLLIPKDQTDLDIANDAMWKSAA